MNVASCLLVTWVTLKMTHNDYVKPLLKVDSPTLRRWWPRLSVCYFTPWLVESLCLLSDWSAPTVCEKCELLSIQPESVCLPVLAVWSIIVKSPFLNAEGWTEGNHLVSLCPHTILCLCYSYDVWRPKSEHD